VSIFVNLTVLNKLENKDIDLEIINKPFLTLVYAYLSFFLNFIRRDSEMMDRGDYALFQKEYYNLFKTKDHKYIASGNLEPKFMKEFEKSIENINKEDEPPRNQEEGIDYRSQAHTDDKVNDVFSRHTRDDLFKKVKNILINNIRCLVLINVSLLF
jgi:crotonobetainyl-CoA:carnitine CoA-transferase CaiB-like acyl-CoA transferase